jgi:hypothetical protein
MPTPTETAILAFVAALAAKAEQSPTVLPPPLRNDDLLSRLTEGEADLKMHVNVHDGDRGETDEALGADLGVGQTYHIEQFVRVEWAVAGGTSAHREQAFDAGRKAIWDAVKPAPNDAGVSYLGGAVDSIRLVEIIPQHQGNAEGLPGVKACEFVFALTFTSSDPF